MLLTILKSNANITHELKNGVVTFLDVLGWKGVYNRQNDALIRLSSLIKGLEKQKLKHRGKGSNLSIIIKSISDTIAIFTRCSIEEASLVIDIHGELSEWAIRESINSEIPIRGAISFGEFAIQENIFIGKAVDEAASWHEYADWIGVHLTPSAEFIYKEDKKNNPIWVMYNPPNKHKLSWTPHCVNWTISWTNHSVEVHKLKDKFRNLGPIVPELANKFTNTLSFLETQKKTKKNFLQVFE